MDFLIGLAFLAAGVALGWAGFRRRRDNHFLARSAAAPALSDAQASLVAMGEITRAVVAAFVVLVGAGVPLAYHAAGGNGVLSVFSIAGFQAMLAGFLIWFVFRTKYPTSWRQATQGAAASPRPRPR